MAAVDAVEQRVGFPDGSRVICWLPSAHVAERTAHHYLPIVYAMTITTCPDPRQIGTLPAGGQPTWFFAVPRVWEKLKAGVEAKLGGDEQALQSCSPPARGGSSSSRRASRSRASSQRGARRRRAEAVRAAAGRDRARRGEAGQRRRRADAARGARLLPRHRRPAGRDLGDVARPAAPARPTRASGSRSAPSACRRPASSSSSPTTASCWRARRS